MTASERGADEGEVCAGVDTIVPVDPEDMHNGRFGVLDSLALLPPKAILTETAMAKAFGVSGRSIRRMVARYELPPAITIGGRSSWFAGRVLAWLEKEAERQEKKVEQITTKIHAFND